MTGLIIVGRRTWLLAGDFNVLLRPEECPKFASHQVPSADMKEFRDCLEDLDIDGS